MKKMVFVALAVVPFVGMVSDLQAQPFGSMPSAGFYSFGPLQNSTLQELVYQGQTSRQMLDLIDDGECIRDLALPVEFDAFVFHATYNDGSMIEFLANPEYGSSERAKEDIDFWAEMFGNVPVFMRKDARSSVHMGNKCGFAYSGNQGHFLIYSGTVKTDETMFYEEFDVRGISNNIESNVGFYNETYDYPAQAQAEEILIHEGAHAALDLLVQDDPSWHLAQQADGEYISDYARGNPDREDVAESFLAWMILRFGNSYSARKDLAIYETIPNRIAYFDEMFSSQVWSGEFSPFSDLKLPDPESWQLETVIRSLNGLADLPGLENQIRLPRESFSQLLATLMDWPKFNSRQGLLDPSEHFTSENIARTLAELRYRVPIDSALMEIPTFMLQDEVYIARLEALLKLLETPMSHIRYTLLKSLVTVPVASVNHLGRKVYIPVFGDMSMQNGSCSFMEDARYIKFQPSSHVENPELLFVSPYELSSFVQTLVNVPQNIVGQELVDHWSDLCIDVGWTANILWNSMGLVSSIIYLERDEVYRQINLSGEIVGISKLDTSEPYPLPEFVQGKLTIPLMVLGRFRAATDEAENALAESVDSSLYGLWRLELEYHAVNDIPAFELGAANKLRDSTGLQGNYPEARLTSSRIDSSTLVLLIPVLETSIGNYLVELEFSEFELFHFEELE